ncbi:MAG: hypothetical protein V4719_00810 [Planctomycetota bacterium]
MAGFGIAQKAVNKAGKVLAKEQAAKAPIGEPRKVKGVTVAPGATRKGIKSRGVKAGDGVAAAKSGLNVGQKPGSTRAPYSPWYVTGTKDRFTGEKGIWAGKKRARKIVKTKSKRMKRGRMTPHGYIKAASAAAESKVLQVMVETLKAGIEKAITKLG